MKIPAKVLKALVLKPAAIPLDWTTIPVVMLEATV